MPDLTVIEGGGEPRDWERQISEQHFESFVVVLLRTLAAGEGAYRLTQEFFRFLEHAQKTEVPIGPVFDGAVNRLHEQAFDTENQDDFRADQRRILQAALRVIAESMARDSAARARLSKREDSLTHAIEEKMLASERRSRENGWSYVGKLTESLGKWPARRK